MTSARIPEGYTSVTPYLVVRDVPAVLAFVKATFHAEITVEPMMRPDGSVMHAEVRIGNARVMMGSPMGDAAPVPAMLYVYIDDADAHYERALAAGGTSLMEPADQAHGDRYGGVQDPEGNQWYMSQHLRDVSQEEYRSQYSAEDGAGAGTGTGTGT